MGARFYLEELVGVPGEHHPINGKKRSP